MGLIEKERPYTIIRRSAPDMYVDMDQYSVSDDTRDRFLNLVEELQVFDGINPVNVEIHPRGGVVVVSWETNEAGAFHIGVTRPEGFN